MVRNGKRESRPCRGNRFERFGCNIRDASTTVLIDVWRCQRMLPQNIEQIDEAVILQLCSAKCPESATLDFKRELPIADDSGRVELLKDVCAFANNAGGHLIYGIAEDGGCASAPRPIQGEPADAAKRRLLQILEARLEPRVLGLQTHVVSVGGGYVLVLRVPASFNGPHRYSHNGYARFVIRSGTHTTELTYPELRAAFDRTATLSERTRQFRAERLAAVASGRISRMLIAGPQCIVHLIPLAAMGGRTTVDVERLYYAEYTKFTYSDWNGFYGRLLNLDGLLVHHGVSDSDPAISYVQVFRSGAFEALRFVGGLVETRSVIWGSSVCWHVRDSIDKLTKAVRDLGLAGPAALGVALLGVGGQPFGMMFSPAKPFRSPADRSDLVIPEVWIERIEDVTIVDDLARSVLDLVYQCFNVARCEAYDQNGNWVLKDRY
jgi:hypothetical protein